MSNPWVKFGQLIALGVKSVVEVVSVDADGSSVVRLRDGSTLRVRGDSVAVGDRAVIQSGEIVGKAPDLPEVTVSV